MDEVAFLMNTEIEVQRKLVLDFMFILKSGLLRVLLRSCPRHYKKAQFELKKIKSTTYLTPSSIRASAVLLTESVAALETERNNLEVLSLRVKAGLVLSLASLAADYAVADAGIDLLRELPEEGPGVPARMVRAAERSNLGNAEQS